jgi:transposase
MQVVYEHCCGLDVHKKMVVACVITPEGKQIRSFGTLTKQLLELSDWLARQGVTHVAMESTGVYWKPVCNILEEGLEVLVVNAKHVKIVPGRKTDVKDAEWIADLLRHGLLRASFVPDRAQRELRELVRLRRRLVQERSGVVNRIQKVLEGANIKLASVASDVTGASGLAMLRQIAAGQSDPEALAELARGRLRDKMDALQDALLGLVGDHQRFMLNSQLRHLDFLDAEIARSDEEVSERMRPFEEALEMVDEIPGVGRRVAEELVAEIGTDMDQFPSAAHLASWAKVSPGNNESAGKRKSGRTGKGNPWLKATLVEAAQAASRTKNRYLSAQYRRLAARRGAKRAIMAVAHSILTSVYYMLSRRVHYHELGGDYFDARDRNTVIKRSVRRIELLGYKVTLQST